MGPVARLDVLPDVTVQLAASAAFVAPETARVTDAPTVASAAAHTASLRTTPRTVADLAMVKFILSSESSRIGSSVVR